MQKKSIRKFFWLIWHAPTTSSIGFIVRAMSVSDWGVEFGLDKTQQANLFEPEKIRLLSNITI